jgi:tRNA pseudouridine13 synthase
MKYKTFPEDFQVNECYDLEELKKKDEGKGEIYGYFILKKKEYTTQKAIEKIAKTFHISPKRIGFAGTKDKVGITTQLISIKGITKQHIENNLPYFNEQEELQLEYLGNYKGRINLGDNLGNSFIITTRDVSEKEKELFEKNIQSIEKEGVYNYFDEQRFGYAGNSHIVGKYLLLGDFQKAFWEILLSIPKNPNEKIKLWNDFLKEHKTNIEEQDQSIVEKIDEIAPKFLRNECKMIKWILHPNKKNDYAGAIRLLPKKIRTLYVHAYQSHVFNQLCDLMKTNKIPFQEQIELVHKNLSKELPYYNTILEILKKDTLTLDHFKLQRTPELQLQQTIRETKIYPKNVKTIEISSQSPSLPHQFIVSFSFSLPSGSYATNVIKQLFE